MPWAVRPKCSSSHSAEPVGANTPGTPRIRIGTGLVGHHDFGDRTAQATVDRMFLDGHDAARFGGCRHDRRRVERANRRHIEHARLDALLAEQFRRPRAPR